jgi:2-aminoadipate transaminase
MNDDRRERLITLAQRAGVPIVEDDPYGELAPQTIFPLVARNNEYVIYLSSFSKTIAPSLRLGWLCAPRTIYDRLLLRKQSYDMASSMYVQASVCDFMQTAYDRHLQLLRHELELRREIAFDAIERFWPASMRPARGGGGYYVWGTTPREMRARSLLDAAERHGAAFLFGEAFFAHGGGDYHFRLAITPVPRDAIAEGIRRIGEAASS